MSYTIEYDHQFIKSELGITPCWLCGDNNVTEYVWRGGRRVERRVRDWSVFCNLLAVTEETIMEELKSFYGGPYQEHWKRNGKYLDDAAILRWGKKGCESAVPIEDVLTLNHMRDVRCYISVWTKDPSNSTTLYTYVSSTKELDDWIGKVKQYISDHPELHIYPIVEFPRDGFVRANPAPKKASGDDLVILKRGRNYYVTDFKEQYGRITGITSAADPKQAMVMKRSEAVRVVAEKGRSYHIVSASVKDKPYNVGIQFGSDSKLPGAYFVCTTKRGFKYCSDPQYAKHFSDETAAKRTMKRLEQHSPQIVTLS